MSYYWVNQGATYNDEVLGECLWAPQVDKNGKSLLHWDTMDALLPGDIVFNYAKGLRGYSIVLSSAVPLSRPYTSGYDYSESQGGRIVFCAYQKLLPAAKIPLEEIVSDPSLKAYLASGASPILDRNYKVAQKYLCPLDAVAGGKLMALLTSQGLPVATGTGTNSPIPKTTVKQLVDARIGQGKFRSDLVTVFSGKCPITGLSRVELLRASHIKPWCTSSTSEKLDPENGLLLAAGLDAAFDKGLISFDTVGNLLTKLTSVEMMAIGLPSSAKLPSVYITPSRELYLKHHRSTSGWNQ